MTHAGSQTDFKFNQSYMSCHELIPADYKMTGGSPPSTASLLDGVNMKISVQACCTYHLLKLLKGMMGQNSTGIRAA